MALNRKKKPAPSRTRKPHTTYDASIGLYVYSDDSSTWPSSSDGSGSSHSSYDSGSSYSSSSDSGSSSGSSDCGGF